MISSPNTAPSRRNLSFLETTLETSEEDVDKTTLETSVEIIDKTTLETSVVNFAQVYLTTTPLLIIDIVSSS